MVLVATCGRQDDLAARIVRVARCTYDKYRHGATVEIAPSKIRPEAVRSSRTQCAALPGPLLPDIMSLRTRLLWQLDRLFPPDQTAFMEGDALTIREEEKASSSMGAYLSELGRTDVDVLDFGCGWGGETLWLARRVRSAAGVDVERASIEQAVASQGRSGITNCRFVHSVDGTVPFAANSFDAVFSTDTFEHVMDLELAFSEIHRVLKPNGVLIARWGPLFLSPHGYHLYWACQVPFAHVLFGLNAVVDLRNARAPRSLVAKSWRDLGLNGKRFIEYRQAAVRAGFTLDRFEPLPVRGLARLSRLPLIGDYLIFGIDCKVSKR
jgi:SAM-dependent methyltransferase